LRRTTIPPANCASTKAATTVEGSSTVKVFSKVRTTGAAAVTLPLRSTGTSTRVPAAGGSGAG
jgi:hypothetical protein